MAADADSTEPMPFLEISAADVTGLAEHEHALILDMRDEQSFRRGHISGARHLTDALIRELKRTAEAERPLVVYCYHGISSRDMALLLVRFGFRRVYSLEGGWQAWESLQAGTAAPPSPMLAKWYAANGFAAHHPFAQDRRGMTPLMAAALTGNEPIVDELLRYPGTINLINGDGNTALWFACKSDNSEIIGKLLQHGADIDHQNREGATCLIYAASSGKLDVVCTLLNAGASLHPETLDGFTALDCAATLPVLRLLRSCQQTS